MAYDEGHAHTVDLEAGTTEAFAWARWGDPTGFHDAPRSAAGGDEDEEEPWEDEEEDEAGGDDDDDGDDGDSDEDVSSDYEE